VLKWWWLPALASEGSELQHDLAVRLELERVSNPTSGQLETFNTTRDTGGHGEVGP
jgi:hypothetical protein